MRPRRTGWRQVAALEAELSRVPVAEAALLRHLAGPEDSPEERPPLPPRHSPLAAALEAQPLATDSAADGQRRPEEAEEAEEAEEEAEAAELEGEWQRFLLTEG
eukprot:468459-Prorocentrum_minimum.AAC.2